MSVEFHPPPPTHPLGQTAGVPQCLCGRSFSIHACPSWSGLTCRVFSTPFLCVLPSQTSAAHQSFFVVSRCGLSVPTLISFSLVSLRCNHTFNFRRKLPAFAFPLRRLGQQDPFQATLFVRFADLAWPLPCALCFIFALQPRGWAPWPDPPPPSSVALSSPLV